MNPAAGLEAAVDIPAINAGVNVTISEQIGLLGLKLG